MNNQEKIAKLNRILGENFPYTKTIVAKAEYMVTLLIILEFPKFSCIIYLCPSFSNILSLGQLL